jgi:hypothetical protein
VGRKVREEREEARSCVTSEVCATYMDHKPRTPQQRVQAQNRENIVWLQYDRLLLNRSYRLECELLDSKDALSWLTLFLLCILSDILIRA